MDDAHHPYLTRVDLIENAVPTHEQFVNLRILKFGHDAAPFWRFGQGTNPSEGSLKEGCGTGRRLPADVFHRRTKVRPCPA
jgi:hypothetical protein